jgi:hypothetical protein
MAKLNLKPDPTFNGKVKIPIAGKEPAEVMFTFKHRSREDVLAWLQEARQRSDTDTVMDMVVGWELDDAFNRDNVELLCSNYAGAGRAIIEKYLAELRGEREKN